MILDDVLVNLDAKRAEATVELLCDFAKEGRQLLFFTCHEHIKQMFVQAAVDIRLLPAHGKPGTKIPRLEFIEVKPKDTLLDFVPPDEEEEIPAEVWDEAFASEVPVEETIGEIEVPYEDEEVAEVVEDGDEEDVDYVFSELDDESAFDDGNWWWEPSAKVHDGRGRNGSLNFLIGRVSTAISVWRRTRRNNVSQIDIRRTKTKIANGKIQITAIRRQRLRRGLRRRVNHLQPPQSQSGPQTRLLRLIRVGGGCNSACHLR